MTAASDARKPTQAYYMQGSRITLTPASTTKRISKVLQADNYCDGDALTLHLHGPQASRAPTVLVLEAELVSQLADILKTYLMKK